MAGLEVGSVYESAARVDVGGDVYDFLELDRRPPRGRSGDVTGHGIEATADMAMAKFVFRSLAREHSDPGEFLARANDVVVDEIALGKFITMTYLTIDAAGEVLCASAGHPAAAPARAGRPRQRARVRRSRARDRRRRRSTSRSRRRCRRAARSSSTPTA